jgi:hypothetical protein
MCQIINEQVSVNTNGSEEHEAPETPVSDEFLAAYVAGLYAGIITEHSLSVELYQKTGSYLDKGLVEGYGLSFETGTTTEETFLKLRKNLWHFSAAKQYTQNRDILRSFVAPLEQIPFEDFKKVADPILSNYNNSWLKTEWRTAVSNSQSAREWGDLMEDDTIEFIQYKTQQDILVRHAHRRLNNARYPKGHSFWNTYFPPNGWNCRCFTVNLDEDTKQNTIDNPPDFGTDQMPKAFKINPGKQQIIYPNSHPYFRVAQGDKVFREANYGMPQP